MKRVMPSYSLYMCKIEALHFFFTSDIIDSATVGSDVDYGLDYSFLLFDAISVIWDSPCAELQQCCATICPCSRTWRIFKGLIKKFPHSMHRSLLSLQIIIIIRTLQLSNTISSIRLIVLFISLCYSNILVLFIQCPTLPLCTLIYSILHSILFYPVDTY